MTPYREILDLVNFPARRLTGQYLARAKLSREQRAKLAAALTDGSAEVCPLTVRQAAALARVPIVYVTAARHANGNGKPGPNGETLAEHIARSTLAERIEAARTVGVDALWDSMLAPIVGQRG